MMTVDESENVSVDARILAELRSRVLTAEQAASKAARADERLDEAEEEISRLKLEVKLRTAGESELSEALRIAQTAAWESNRDRAASDAQLELARGEIESLTDQIRRINSSRAWKAVSAYRRVVKRLRSSR